MSVRLAGTPLVVQGLFGSAEGGPGCHNHLLHVNLYDAGGHQETPREDHAEFLLERFPAQRSSGGIASCMVYYVNLCLKAGYAYAIFSIPT